MTDVATKPTRVLVVDDDRSMRLLCSANLELEGFVVLEADDGRAGLECAYADHPDLVVTDVAMPDLDGFGLAEALRRDMRTRLIPLIFLSGESSLANRARASELGAHAYLTKPFDLTKLPAIVTAALERVREPCPTM